MHEFNLIISTGREFESQAECEAWFNLMAIGDPTPILFKSPFQGLILGHSSIPPRKLVHYLRDIINTKNADYIQFIQKVIPIDVVTVTEIPVIRTAVQDLILCTPICHDPSTKFRITVRKRNSPITPEELISQIAPLISHPVDLKGYDWNLQFEIFGNQTGIAILRKEDVFKPISERQKLLFEKERAEITF
ncbi:MAG: THUMP domain-containing protein [Promethearchaeota archaeon]